ncbi:MAG: hypothetical protein QOJ94_451 [Sphingomonadales bacterium]|jgi:TolB-like protein|nr:hypothetical protein [Sphingomonadales bacterium]
MIEGGTAQWRRINLAAEPEFDLGPLRVRPSRRQLVLGTNDVSTLEPRVMQVLIALAGAKGEVVSRDRLNDLCWGGRIVGDDSINRCIRALRRLARRVNPPPFAIETVAGIGYALVPAGSDGGARAAPPISGQKTELPKSVAVLPFANLTGDPAKDYLADGMAEELIATLTRATGLKVPARTSTFSYKGRETDVRTIARDLSVDAVLEGSVRAAGERIRVTAQLVDAQTGFHLWSQNYDRDIGDLFAVQDELAGIIARTLKAKLGGGRHRADPQAYELYLQARGFAARATPDSLRRAIELHEQAIARDPDFSRAWSGLAGTLMEAIVVGQLPLERRAEARARAEQAIRLDPGDADPYAIVAALDTAAGRWIEAEAGFRTAIELNPEKPAAIGTLALHLLATCGQLRRSFELAGQAVRLAPAAANLQLSCALVANLLGEREARDRHFENALLLGLSEERGAVRLLRSSIADEAGHLKEAEALMIGAFEGAPCLAEAGIADVIRRAYSALANEDERRSASAAIDTFVVATDADEALWRIAALPAFLLRWQVMLGSLDGAFAIADRIIEAWRRSGHLAYLGLPLLWRKETRPFRRDPRFQQLVGKLGLVEFWSRHGPPDGYRLDGGGLIEQPPPA